MTKQNLLPACKGILFVPEMVNAIANTQPDIWPALAIRGEHPIKSQTRRAIKNVPAYALIRQEFSTTEFTWKGRKPTGRFYNDNPLPPHQDDCQFFKPLYPVGTILYVRERHWRLGKWVSVKKTRKGRTYWGRRFKACSDEIAFEQPDGIPNVNRRQIRWHQRPAIFMPKSMTRFWIKVMAVGVQQVCDISRHDARAEGIDFFVMNSKPLKLAFRHYGADGMNDPICDAYPFHDERKSFRTLYESINGPDSFKDWVWVYDFMRINPPQLFQQQ